MSASERECVNYWIENERWVNPSHFSRVFYFLDTPSSPLLGKVIGKKHMGEYLLYQNISPRYWHHLTLESDLLFTSYSNTRFTTLISKRSYGSVSLIILIFIKKL